ncbi:hypothetical protein EZ449_17555 [Pedobacter frigidisoli]|uniref:Uncharacterized protein n=1 Tax=Pedobacter frigidisoli TaxID=2530455 RepID=A0A4R0NT89_9SPHI|nr:hypothetical protein [Pedobacter frigidisoli]TCD04442.1 hypothetical protein EZ449_17555 [Pedobacter frigidisoli]
MLRHEASATDEKNALDLRVTEVKKLIAENGTKLKWNGGLLFKKKPHPIEARNNWKAFAFPIVKLREIKEMADTNQAPLMPLNG